MKGRIPEKIVTSCRFQKPRSVEPNLYWRHSFYNQLYFYHNCLKPLFASHRFINELFFCRGITSMRYLNPDGLTTDRYLPPEPYVIFFSCWPKSHAMNANKHLKKWIPHIVLFNDNSFAIFWFSETKFTNQSKINKCPNFSTICHLWIPLQFPLFPYVFRRNSSVQDFPSFNVFFLDPKRQSPF